MKLNMNRRIAGAALLLLLATFGILSTQEDLSPRLEELVRELQAEREARPTSRVPVGGPSQPGLAWESYWAAAEKFKAQPKGVLASINGESMAACEAGPEQRRTESVRLAALISEELALLREGARRSNISPVYFPDKPIADLTITLRDSQGVVHLFGLLAVAELEAGNQAEGVALLLDSMQIAQDYMHSPVFINQMIGASEVCSRTLERVLAAEGFGMFSAESLSALDAGVAQLLERMPTRPYFGGELEHAARQAMKDPMQLVDQSQSLFSRLFGRSPSWAQAVIRADELNHVLAESELSEFMGLLRRVWSEREPVLYIAHHWWNMNQITRHAVVRLQIFHHALRLAQGLEPAPFADPFGMPLSLTESDDSWVLEVDAVYRAEPIIKTFRKGLSED
ncbi:MAG: hypothetical protein ACI8QC_003422 [Planctomycetota bacterium]|jgi:hypothetical protein